MYKQLSNLHRFFVSQMLYPLILSSLLAMTLYIGRIFLSHDWLVYRHMVWNLFLAWLPYLFSFWAAATQRVLPGRWFLLLLPGAIWLIFFPNAPYIITDFLHLQQRPYVPLWYDILLLATFSWTGIFLAVASLKTMQDLIRIYLGSFISWIFVAVALGMSGLGIYLGRFERWNSWDLFLHPKKIFYDIAVHFADPSEHLHFFAFTFLFTAFLLVCYLTFISVRGSDEPKVQEK